MGSLQLLWAVCVGISAPFQVEKISPDICLKSPLLHCLRVCCQPRLSAGLKHSYGLGCLYWHCGNASHPYTTNRTSATCRDDFWGQSPLCQLQIAALWRTPGSGCGWQWLGGSPWQWGAFYTQYHSIPAVGMLSTTRGWDALVLSSAT